MFDCYINILTRNYYITQLMCDGQLVFKLGLIDH